jgi:hypothetical protein
VDLVIHQPGEEVLEAKDLYAMLVGSNGVSEREPRKETQQTKPKYQKLLLQRERKETPKISLITRTT